MGTLQVVGISVGTGISAGVVGWWSRTSALLGRWVDDARRCSMGTVGSPPTIGKARTGAPAGSSRAARPLLSPFLWPFSTGLAAATLVAVLLLGRREPLSAVPFFLVWGLGLALLALIDLETLFLPSRLIHSCALAVGCLLVAEAVATGQWDDLARGTLCAFTAYGAYGAWAFLQPSSLGLGDARMACLVAFGAGTISPAGCVVALTCAPAAAAGVSTFRRAPIAMGPFLALAGIAAVVASAA